MKFYKVERRSDIEIIKRLLTNSMLHLYYIVLV